MLQTIFSMLLSLGLPQHLRADSNDPGPKGWTVCPPLGGQITSEPAACTAGDVTFVFFRGSDGTLDYKVWAS